MAKENYDRITLDLFYKDRRPGRPKTNTLSRHEQVKINKRKQLQRDKNRGIHRIELKMDVNTIEILNKAAKKHNMGRSEFINLLLLNYSLKIGE